MTIHEFVDIYRAEGDALASMYKAAAMGLRDEVTNDFQRNHESFATNSNGIPASNLSQLISVIDNRH